MEAFYTQWMRRLVCFALISTGMLCGLVNAQIFDVKAQVPLPVEALANTLQEADVILLGELHDNPHHHRARAQLIDLLKDARRAVVTEHLSAPSSVTFSGSTLDSLESAGFSPQAWGWPLHAPLFDAVRASGASVIGGNLPKGFSKDIFKNRQQAFPPQALHIYQQSPLSDTARQSLNQDLINGHCGQLPEQYLEPMRLVQRATDISMAIALIKNKPALLVAGNGHVRKDYGVPQVLAATDAALKIISIGFYEQSSDMRDQLQSLSAKYDYVWFTEPATRENPCENFTLK